MTHCDPIAQTQTYHCGGLRHIWPHIFCSVNANASWFISHKDVTEKYVMIAGGGICFGHSMPKKMERSTGGRGWSAGETRSLISIWAEYSVQRKLDNSYRNRAIYKGIARKT